MKAATGELQLTVITMIAIAAVIAFFWFMWPSIQNSINKQWDNISGDYKGRTTYIIK
jgi:hypothetical protein